MDPYLESPTHWSDFHYEFIATIRARLNELLPKGYVARLGEHVVLQASTQLGGSEGRTAVPDVTVTATYVARGGPAASSGEGAVATVPLQLEELELLDDVTEIFVQITRLPDLQLVAVIELMSPFNKYGEGRGDYMRKRREYRRQGVHVVELDLLRGGTRHEFSRPLPPAHYFAYITRGGSHRTEGYPWTIRDRFPTIAIPLLPPDPDVRLDLNAPFAAAYERGRYRELIDYSDSPPLPAFSQEDREWVRQTVGSDRTQS
jgi:hypothetical protein